MQVQPYLFFEGRCEEALDYYRKTLGAEVQMLMRYKDSPEAPQGKTPPPPGDKVMHAAFRIGDTKFTLVKNGVAQIKTVMTDPATGASTLETAYAHHNT